MVLIETNNQKRTNLPKVLFYTSILRIFRSTLIGCLHEIVQVYPVILLSEKLDAETEKILNNKILFPKLEKIIRTNQFTEEKINLFSKNKCLFKQAKNIVRKYQPKIIIMPTDIYLFEMYLMRFGKKISSINLSIQGSLCWKSLEESKRIDLINAFLRFPSFLPFLFRLFLAKLRKHVGHFYYYWILPLSLMEKPFFGKSSYITRKGQSGMRDADYQIVFSKRDYDIFLKDGVPAEKLYILPHFLSRNNAKNFFKKETSQNKKEKNILLLLPLDVEFGFKKNNYSLISAEEREKSWIEIIKIICDNLPGWKVFVKPHPVKKNLMRIKDRLKISNVEFLDQNSLAEEYVEKADVIIGLPLSCSTVLFTSFIQYPEKPILSLDFQKEILGDFYNNFEGIEYIDNKNRFISILKLINKNKYQKKHKKIARKGLEKKEFSNSVEMIKFFLREKIQT